MIRNTTAVKPSVKLSKSAAKPRRPYLLVFGDKKMTVGHEEKEVFGYIKEALKTSKKVRHSGTDWMEKKDWYGRFWNACGISLGTTDFMFICNSLSKEGGEVTVESDSPDISLELLAAAEAAGAGESAGIDG
jgi:hypothetical protein